MGRDAPHAAPFRHARHRRHGGPHPGGHGRRPYAGLTRSTRWSPRSATIPGRAHGSRRSWTAGSRVTAGVTTRPPWSSGLISARIACWWSRWRSEAATGSRSRPRDGSRDVGAGVSPRDVRRRGAAAGRLIGRLGGRMEQARADRLDATFAAVVARDAARRVARAPEADAVPVPIAAAIFATRSDHGAAEALQSQTAPSTRISSASIPIAACMWRPVFSPTATDRCSRRSRRCKASVSPRRGIRRMVRTRCGSRRASRGSLRLLADGARSPLSGVRFDPPATREGSRRRP